MGILDGRAIVVTGAGRGIGRGHCLVLASEGASVVVNDVDIAEAQKVVDEIEEAGGSARASGHDIGTRVGCEELIEGCAVEFGRVDGVVNNAGIVRDRTFLKMSDEEFDDVYRIHVKGTFWCSQEAARRMVEQGTGGSIVNTTSGAHMGNFGQTNYAGAKGAIASMTYTWAMELARYGIRVNSIAPQATTRMTGAIRDKEGKTVEVPFIDPNLNAPVVAYLMSDEGNYVTGQIIGTGGDRLVIMDQPAYGATALREGGWSVDSVRKYFKQSLGNRLESFGLRKAPYPHYDGVGVPNR
ncbi:SDR family NAD(P)-dependent oxidoreductase [Myxococcota bacterium]|nr:SDR family NAD(P)-dependent oxidoreductase [Myxococcota bacterium]